MGFDCAVPGRRMYWYPYSSKRKSDWWWRCQSWRAKRSPCSVKTSVSNWSLAGAGDRVMWKVDVCPPRGRLGLSFWLRPLGRPDCFVSMKSIECTCNHIGSSRLLWCWNTWLKCSVSDSSVRRGSVASTCGLGL